jgi:uncharacterized pyridoxamine 5'-phosphate oxidase family protein
MSPLEGNMPIDLQEVYQYLVNGGLISLATVEGDRPRVRPVSLIADGREFYFISFKDRGKIHQLETNEKFEFFFGIKVGEKWGSIRASGRAIIVEEEEIDQELVDMIPLFNDRSDSPDRPEYALVRLDIEEFVVQDPEDGAVHRFVVRRESDRS